MVFGLLAIDYSWRVCAFINYVFRIDSDSSVLQEYLYKL